MRRERADEDGPEDGDAVRERGGKRTAVLPVRRRRHRAEDNDDCSTHAININRFSWQAIARTLDGAVDGAEQRGLPHGETEPRDDDLALVAQLVGSKRAGSAVLHITSCLVEH